MHRLFLFFTLSLLFVDVNLHAQLPKNIWSYVISTTGDTVQNPFIRNELKFTNEDRIEYALGKSSKALAAADIVQYFTNQQLFVSEIVSGSSDKKLINYIVTGPVYFGQSFPQKGETKFWIKVSSTQQLVCLESYRYNLKDFLKDFLPNFESFRREYGKSILYEYKSLAEFVSDYNAFNEPKMYVPAKYGYIKYSRLGVFASSGIGQFKFSNSAIAFTPKRDFSVGADFRYHFSKHSFLHTSSSFSSSKFVSTEQDVYLSTANLVPGLGFNSCFNSRLNYSLTGGFDIIYNIDSQVNLKNSLGVYKIVNIKNFNIGYQIGISVEYLKRYCIFTTYSSYRLKTDDFLMGSIDSSKKSADLSFIRLGLLYYFK